jgi:hypothetical protein
MAVEFAAVFALIGLAILRLGVPIVLIWLLGKAVKYVAPSPG